MLQRQKFGTAGLRARMGAGYNCMNDVVVLQTAQVGHSRQLSFIQGLSEKQSVCMINANMKNISLSKYLLH